MFDVLSEKQDVYYNETPLNIVTNQSLYYI